MIFKNVSDTSEYIKKNNIVNVDIRYFDEEGILKGFSLNANNLSLKIFQYSNFTFNKINLLGISLNRSFKDPFLPHPTLVFLTNLVSAKNVLAKLKNNTIISKTCFFNFYLKSEDNNLPQFNYCLPPFDTDRDIRNEVILALKEMGVLVTAHFHGKENNQNTIYIKVENQLELLDITEKVKYAILMVANAYNKVVDYSKGIFIQKSLLIS